MRAGGLDCFPYVLFPLRGSIYFSSTYGSLSLVLSVPSRLHNLHCISSSLGPGSSLFDFLFFNLLSLVGRVLSNHG